ncbi:hypothetical protein, partial [Azospirillum sp. TSO22-1]|uniref:hypothetical protein n=1 Tax=Azospirillum sp. TSO22-1 TaxID=716789 RepID=UPI000D619696
MDTFLTESIVASLAPAPALHPWRGFAKGVWQTEVNVRDFIVRNVNPYEGDRAFLAGATGKTKALWDTVAALL